MQRDPKKLAEASYRRLIGKGLLTLLAVPFTDYALFLASGGYRDLYGAGHWNLAIALTLFVTAVIVMKPVYRLEWPFQYQLEQRRKIQKS
ncbi:hypothetical protein [Marinobacter sp. MBR-105]|jgi:hypothetical protein